MIPSKVSRQQMSAGTPLVLVVLGLAGLAWFAWFVWPPLVVLVLSVSCLVTGLLVDWEALGGKPASTPSRR